MKKIMFGNSLMLLGIAIMILAGLELIYIGIMWASFLLIPVGFIMAVIGFLAKTVKFQFGELRKSEFYGGIYSYEKYKIAAILMIIHGGFMELGGILQ